MTPPVSRWFERRRTFWLTLAIFAFVPAFPCFLPPPLSARQISDSRGRLVAIPDKPSKVYGASPPVTCLIYAVDPKLLCGLNFPFPDAARAYLLPGIAKLPILGGWFGQGRVPNLESLARARPDLVLLWDSPFFNVEQNIASLRKLGIPALCVRCDRLEDYPAAFRFLGDALGCKERGDLLADYAAGVVAALARLSAALPPSKKSFYYAEGNDGLRSEPGASFHVEPLLEAGGVNIIPGIAKDHFGMVPTDREQVISANPDFLFVQEPAFYRTVYQEKWWMGLNAVQDRHVFLIPKYPFNWLDRPPSFLRLLGVQWVANLFYPNVYPLDLKRETLRFYRLFLGIDLDDRLYESLFHP